MIIDKDEERISRLADVVTAAKVGDCQDEDVLRALGVQNFDICFVCIRDDFQTSLEVTSTLKELGAKYVVAHAERERQMKFLRIIGADEVLHAELDMAIRAAVRYSSKEAFEYFELTPEYAIFEISVPVGWVGKTVLDLDARQKYGVNVIARKIGGTVIPFTSTNHIFTADEHLIVGGRKVDTMKMINEKP